MQETGKQKKKKLKNLDVMIRASGGEQTGGGVKIKGENWLGVMPIDL